MAVNVYGIPHQKFLQGMMSRKVCNAAESRELFARCFEEDKPVNFENNIGKFIRQLNTRISRFHIEIRKGVDEQDGSHSYCLVNCQESVLSLQASDYTPAELQYFQSLIASIVRSPDGLVSTIDALNLTIEQAKPMSTSNADELLKRFKTNHWIVETGGKVALSTLSILEFESYIKEIFAEEAELKCGLCKQLVISGDTCAGCDLKCHRHCVNRVSLKVCPRCNSQWHRHTAASKTKKATPGSQKSQKVVDDDDDEFPMSVELQKKRR